MLYRDRHDAGRRLAEALSGCRGRSDLIVLALPRGGVPVGFEVARALRAPLDVMVVRKLGVPGYPEYAMGAIASGDVQVLNDDVLAQLAIGPAAIARVVERERTELARREQAFRGARPWPRLGQRTVVLVDDGSATGATMSAAVRAVRAQRPRRVIVALPVAAADACRRLRAEADELVCPETPEPFGGVGHWYADFTQTSDDEVIALLRRARHERRARTPPQPRPGAPR